MLLLEKKDKNCISELNVNGDIITDTKKIVDEFNKHVCTVGHNLQRNVKHLGGAGFKAYMPPTTKASMFVTPVTKEEVLEIIWKFKNNKSPGPDSIGPRLLKEVINEIIDPLVYLFNLSFSTGLVPESLKLAKVIPVYKKSDRSYVGNYRPISLLSIFDKILEKAMCA